MRKSDSEFVSSFSDSDLFSLIPYHVPFFFMLKLVAAYCSMYKNHYIILITVALVYVSLVVEKS